MPPDDTNSGSESIHSRTTRKLRRRRIARLVAIALILGAAMLARVIERLAAGANLARTTSEAAVATGDFQLPLDLSYEVDLSGRIRRGVVAAGEQARASAATLETVRLSLHAERAVDYFELCSADAQQRLLDETVTAYSDSLQLTRARLDGEEDSR